MARSGRSRAQRARLVQQWRTRGGSQAAFARRHGVHPRTFWGWCHAVPPARARPTDAPRFVPVQVRRSPAPAEPATHLAHRAGLEIVLVSGERVRVAPDTVPAWVAAIVVALRPAC